MAATCSWSQEPQQQQVLWVEGCWQLVQATIDAPGCLQWSAVCVCYRLIIDSFIVFCNASCHTIRIHAAWSKCCLIYKLKLRLIKQLTWPLDLYAISNQQHSTIVLSLLMLTFTCIHHFRYPSPCQGLSNPKWLLSKSRASKPWPSKLTKPP